MTCVKRPLMSRLGETVVILVILILLGSEFYEVQHQINFNTEWRTHAQEMTEASLRRDEFLRAWLGYVQQETTCPPDLLHVLEHLPPPGEGATNAHEGR